MLTRPLERLARGLQLEAGEGRRLALMGALVMVLLFAYTIAKVLRDALFLQEFGALLLPYAYIGVALATAGFVWADAGIARNFATIGASRFQRHLAIVLSLAAAWFHPLHPRGTAAVFYVWTGSQLMMLVPHFWVLGLELWDSRRARLVFPVLTGCGLLGGLAAGAFAAWATPVVKRTGLLWMLPLLLLLAHVLTSLLEAHRAARDRTESVTPPGSPWKTIRGTPYLRVLAVALALSVMVGTLVDFQFKYLAQRSFFDPVALTQFLGRFYVGLHALSLLLQFGAVGWLLHRLGLGVATGTQPAAILMMAAWSALAPGLWVVIAMRWTQGVLGQTLGKSAHEIYYAAIRPRVRRLIKPAIDTLAERWSDAAVGLLLVIALHTFGLRFATIGILTAALAALWLAALVVLDRQYGRAFQQMLSSRWIEPEDPPEAVRTPAARRALVEALHAEDERRILLALQLSGCASDARIGGVVRECLGHPSPAVRAAAVTAMASLGLGDATGRIEALLDDPHEEPRRAAVRHRILRGPGPVAFAREVLEGGDRTLQRFVLDVLFDHFCAARSALTLAWAEARATSAHPDDAWLAARALGVLPGRIPVGSLRALLAHPDLEVRRAALITAIHRPAPALLGALMRPLLTPGLHHEARLAVAALGDPAVPRLERLLTGRRGARAQSVAADTLAQIGTRRAIEVLLRRARSSDLRSRHLGLRGLARARVRAGRPVLGRSMAHRLFLREVRECRECLDAAAALETHSAPEVRLLADSYRECADWGLERAVQALACWYEPRPLIGALRRLRSRDREQASPALEYLEHLLPRSVFAPMRKVFEQAPSIEPEAARAAAARWIEAAWNSGDSWLRACAVRAAVFCAPFAVRRMLAARGEAPHVSAEIAWLKSVVARAGHRTARAAC